MTGPRLALAFALGAFATAAGAQTPIPPQLTGEVTAEDPTDSDGRRYDEFAIEAQQGQRLTITAAPSAGSSIDPIIEVYGPQGEAPVERDDDGGGGRNARVTLGSLATGTYRVRILGATEAIGGYRLSIRAGVAAGATDTPASPAGGANAPAPPAPAGQSAGVIDGPREAFIICPGHSKCPRR